jgi:hypothetical protein
VYRYWALTLIGLLMFSLTIVEQSWAQSTYDRGDGPLPGTVFDCADVTIDYTDNSSLTREEKLAKMDQALFESLSKFDECQRSNSSENASDGSAASANGANSGGGSVASTDMFGTEKPASSETTQNEIQGGGAMSDPTQSGSTTEIEKAGKPVTQADLTNGKLPEDIPSADNDSVLEAQIRQAAINEADPEIKARLWNEYRKYKGLPTQE